MVQTVRDERGQIHSFPDDASPEEMNNAISEDSHGWGSVGRDLLSSLKSAPEAGINLAKSIWPGIKNVASYATSNNPFETLANLGGGGVESVAGLASSPQQFARYIAEKFPQYGELLEKGRTINRQGSLNDPTIYESLINFEKEHGLSAQSPEEQSVRNLGGLLFGGKILSKLPNIGSRVATLAAQQGGEGGDPLHAAIFGLLGEGAGYGGSKAKSKVANNIDWSKKYSSPLSNEEILSNAQAAEGTNTGLGRIINNPELMRYLETESRKYPQSGSEEILGATGNQVKDIGQGIINDFKGDIPIEHYGDEVLKALKESKKDVTKEKNAKYKIVNDLAEKHGVDTDRGNFIKTAQDELDTMKSDPHLSLFQNKAEIAKLEQIVKNNKGKRYSLRDTDFLIGKLGEEMQSHFEKGNTAEYNLYKKLRDNLIKDREDAIENSSAPEELKNAHNEAKNFYKNEYAAYEDPDIAKWLRRGGDTDLLIRHFIRTGKFSDRSKLIQKIQDKIPEDKKHILGSAYLTGAIKDGDFNPHHLRQLYKGLGEKQRQVLFPDKVNKQLANYSRLVEMNPEPLSMMSNPKTGFRGVQNTSIKDLVMPAVMAAGGGHYGGVPGALGAALLPHIMGKANQQFIIKPKVEKITSQEFRQKFIRKLLDERAKNG
jgi:hypothetical protein